MDYAVEEDYMQKGEEIIDVNVELDESDESEAEGAQDEGGQEDLEEVKQEIDLQQDDDDEAADIRQAT